MKWQNRGHEFDELGEYLKKTKTIYLYGAVQSAESLIELFEKAIYKANNNEMDLNVVFVDRNQEKQSGLFLGKKVISPEEFYENFSEENGLVVMCVGENRAAEIWEQMKECGIHRKFHAFSVYEFYRYLSLFLLYRYNKMYLHAVDLFLHTYCNLNCEYCFVQTYRGVHRKITIDAIKRNIDVVFNKCDYVGIVFFGIAEGFLGGKELEFALRYITDHYSDRFMTVEIVTNGTIIPSQSLLEVIKNKKIRIVVDDYRENVKLAEEQYLKVIKMLEENDVNYSSLKRDHWDVSCFGDNVIEEDPEKLGQKLSNCVCHAKGFPYIGYKEGSTRMYSCVFQTINEYLGLIEEYESDSLEFATANPLEIIEFLLGYNDVGYLSACAYCNGIFEGVEINHIPVAEQIPSNHI